MIPMYSLIDGCITNVAIPKEIDPGDPLLDITILRYSAKIALKLHCTIKLTRALFFSPLIVRVIPLTFGIIFFSTVHPINAPTQT